MWSELFQAAWFGPFTVPDPYTNNDEEVKHPGEAYNYGPLDGLLSTSIWSQRFAQIPIVNYAQNPGMMGSAGMARLGQNAYPSRNIFGWGK